MGKLIDITGQRFGRLVVLEFAYKTKRRQSFWKCQCDCGNTTYVYGGHLKTGHTTSCGCRLNEIKENIKNLNYKNGLSTSRIHNVYCDMVNRCKNENVSSYKYYGKKGINVCSEWLGENGFDNFYQWSISNGYKEEIENGRNKWTIDRIDSNKDYSPENCRWVDIYTQANNKSTNVFLTYNGKTQTATQWSKEVGISSYTILHRKKRGWSDEKALTAKSYIGRNKFSKD